MKVLNVVGKIKGYVVVCIEGNFTERFLNICMRRGIFLWNVKRMGELRVFAHMGIEDFKNIRSIAFKTHTKVKITKRCGLPFVLHRYRRRKALVAGIIVFLMILRYLTTHIMGIDVFGSERVSAEVVMRELKTAGVYYGADIRKIDRRLVQNRLMTSLDDVAWVGVNIKGSRVFVEIKERLNTKVEIEKDIPCNIIATRDGVVREMNVKAGQTVVKNGEMVEKGDLLVSGAVDSTKEGIRYVHAFGEIYADTLYKETAEYPLEYAEKVYDGMEKKKYGIKVFGKTVNLFLDKTVPFKTFDVESKIKEYRTPVGFIPSFSVVCNRYRSYATKTKNRTEEEAVEFAKQDLCEKINIRLPQGTEIKNIKVTHNLKDDKTVEVTVEYLCLENIAIQTPIDKIENLDYDITEIKP